MITNNDYMHSLQQAVSALEAKGYKHNDLMNWLVSVVCKQLKNEFIFTRGKVLYINSSKSWWQSDYKVTITSEGI